MTKPRNINPAGMSYERALQIAVESLERTGARVEHVPSPNASTFRLSDVDRARIIDLSGSHTFIEIALEVGVSDRTVARVLAKAHDDAMWRAAEKRRLNLESFRRMDTVWEVSACPPRIRPSSRPSKPGG